MENYEKLLLKINNISSRLFKNSNGEVYIFGSQARRDFHSDSDWDLLILIENSTGKENDFNEYGFPFCEMGWENDIDINPLVYSKKEWEAQRYSFFFHNIMKDAIKLYS